MKRAAILNIGSELMAGHTLNSHAQYVSRVLSSAGYLTDYHISCADNAAHISDALNLLKSRVELIIVTGGLGPTRDDITREVVSQFLELPLVEDKSSKRKLIEMFKRFSGKVTKNNYQQTYFPKGAQVIRNDYGTADGFVVTKDNLTIAALPGPTNEMKHVLERVVAQFFNSGKVKYEASLKLFGAGESVIDDLISDIKSDDVYIGIYVSDSIITIRLTAFSVTEDAAKALVNPLLNDFKERLKHLIYAEAEQRLVEVVVAQLKQNKLTLSTAESCTGGAVAAEITSVSGASDVFVGGVVSYSNNEKVRQLGVSEATLAQFGAVSPETAREMAIGLTTRTQSDIGVAITGIAGPTGGTAEKPVGLVYIATCYRGEVVVDKHLFKRNRAKNQHYATLYALKAVLDRIG